MMCPFIFKSYYPSLNFSIFFFFFKENFKNIVVVVIKKTFVSTVIKLNFFMRIKFGTWVFLRIERQGEEVKPILHMIVDTKSWM